MKRLSVSLSTALAAGALLCSVATAREVELVLTGKKPASFADAAANKISEVKDGDDLWVAVRTAMPLTEYTRAELNHKGQPRFYEMALSLGPVNDPRDFGNEQCFVKLALTWAAKNEFIMSLSPAMGWTLTSEKTGGKGGAGGTESHLNKNSCFLEAVAGMRAAKGRWSNRVTLRDFKEGSPTETQALANAPITVDVSQGFPRYARQLSALAACDPKGAAPQLCAAK